MLQSNSLGGVLQDEPRHMVYGSSDACECLEQELSNLTYGLQIQTKNGGNEPYTGHERLTRSFFGRANGLNI